MTQEEFDATVNDLKNELLTYQQTLLETQIKPLEDGFQDRLQRHKLKVGRSIGIVQGYLSVQGGKNGKRSR